MNDNEKNKPSIVESQMLFSKKLGDKMDHRDERQRKFTLGKKINV